MFQTKYTEAQKTFVREHYGGRMSASEIARRMGLRKNQLVGLANRLGLKRSDRNPVGKTGSRPRKVGPRRRSARALGIDDPLAGSDASEATRRAALKPGGRPPHVLSREPRCQFIAGQPTVDDACKCGEPTLPGWPYCAEHRARCYQRRAA